MRFRNQKGKLACVDDTVVKHVSQVTCSSPGGGENTASGGGSGCSLHGVGETAACDAGHFLQSVGGAAACGGAGVCSLHGEGETTALGGSTGCSLHGEGETAAFGGSSGCSLYGEGETGQSLAVLVAVRCMVMGERQLTAGEARNLSVLSLIRGLMCRPSPCDKFKTIEIAF